MTLSSTSQPSLAVRFARPADIPFLLALIGALVVFTFVPDIVLWLPRLLGYQGAAP